MSDKEQIDRLWWDSHDSSAQKDFEIARANLFEIVEQGKDYAIKLGDLANKSQHPAVYDVLRKFLDSLVAANKELLDLQYKIRHIKNIAAIQPKAEKAAITHQTAIFVGSTAELQKALKDLKSGNIIEHKKDEGEK